MSTSKQPLILMAEDDADDRLLAQDAFGESGVTGNVRFVSDGQELMDYLLHGGKYTNTADSPKPDLVLLDLNMPRKDGREVLKEIRQTASLRRVPVVVFTTSNADTDIEKMYELGANSFVTKPAAFDALVNTWKSLSSYWFGIVELPTSTQKTA